MTDYFLVDQILTLIVTSSTTEVLMEGTELSVQCWNIYGIFNNINGFKYNKLHDSDFTKQTELAKILGLVETQHTADDVDSLQLEGYKCYQVCRKKKKKGRKHGGISVYVHNSILKGVSKVPTQGSDIVMLKLDKIFFRLDKDTHLLFAYCSPTNSSYSLRSDNDPISDIEQMIASLGPNANVVLLGDINGRTGNKPDYIVNEENTDMILPEGYVTDTVATFPRGNMDTVTNQQGDQLIALCKSVPLRICNGRKLGDIQGQYTCHTWNGQSVVDFCLASTGIYNQIAYLKVGKFYPLLSDHCPLSIALRCYLTPTASNLEEYKFIPKPGKLSWDQNISFKFETIIQSKESKQFLDNFAKNGIKSDQMSIDTSAEFLTDFLVNSAIAASNNSTALLYKGEKRSEKRNWKFRKKKGRNIVKPKWHDSSCESLSRDIKRSALILKKYPNNSYLRGLIQSETKKYKRLVKSKHKEYLNKLFNDLDIMHASNPKGYMDLVKSLRNGSFDQKSNDDTKFINPKTWRGHFSTLLGPVIDENPSDQQLMKFVQENCDQYESELSRPFTKSEFLKGVSGLANNKATSFDKISNEILKAAKLVIANPVVKLFNSILSNSIYPSQWKLDILSPIHKSGDKSDTNNFRGITVSSCFGKLFNKLLQKRLENWCSTNKKISMMQGSGKAGSRTADHLLIVKFLIDKYVKKKGKHLFTCFVDLQKAFDNVPRPKLFYKLLTEYSIGGKFLKILQEMYKNNKIFVKLSEGLLEPFESTISVKQGCVFSPILFNLYIDKICNSFDKSCDPVQVNDIELNCLLWADDLLLISKSDVGLQNCIDKMEAFYSKVGLKINLKKSKSYGF